MFELSVNLEYMFLEAGEAIEDRIAAAATAGYGKVELFSTADRDIEAISQALARDAVELWSLVVDPRTMLVNPETHESFRDLFCRTAKAARTLNCKQLVVGSGVAVPYQKRSVQLETLTQAVSSVVPIAEDLDVTILIEAVNTRHDHPGVLFSETPDAVTVVRGVDSPRVGLLYDMYHSITEGEEPADILPQVIDLVAHVQVADVPGRGEPGSSTVDWPQKLNLLHDLGYSGVIGIECRPTTIPTADALKYFQELCMKV